MSGPPLLPPHLWGSARRSPPGERGRSWSASPFALLATARASEAGGRGAWARGFGRATMPSLKGSLSPPLLATEAWPGRLYHRALRGPAGDAAVRGGGRGSPSHEPRPRPQGAGAPTTAPLSPPCSGADSPCASDVDKRPAGFGPGPRVFGPGPRGFGPGRWPPKPPAGVGDRGGRRGPGIFIYLFSLYLFILPLREER